MLAAVIFLGGFLDAATDSSLLNTTTAESPTVEPRDHSTDRPTPAPAPTTLSSTTVTDKQLDTRNQDNGEENSNKEEEKEDSKIGGEDNLKTTPSSKVLLFYTKLLEVRETLR